jgi:two-component system, cell cycle sensor histidine kinase PleC
LKRRQREYVGLIRQSGQHLLEVISEILDLAKVDAGKFELRETQGLEPYSLAEASLAVVKGHSDAANLRLELIGEEPLPLINADATRLKQILLNLLSNAVKFTAVGGHVRLTLRCNEAGGLDFIVEDSGPGMTLAQVAIALEPFSQIDRGDGRCRDGTGLGLPLARRLCELHGGTLSIDSDERRGTRITMRLPAARVSAAVPAAPPMDLAAAD